MRMTPPVCLWEELKKALMNQLKKMQLKFSITISN